MTSNTTQPSLFAQLAKLGTREVVDLGGVKVEIVETSFNDRAKLGKIQHSGEDEETIGTLFLRALIYACCYAPGTSDKAFSSPEQVGELPMALLLQIAEHAKRINGLSVKPELAPDPDAEESIHEPSEAEKNG
jgi:hypothetical protein